MEALLRARDLKTYFFTRRGTGKAVDGVSFDLAGGETLGVVGESGSGKSVMGLSLVGLHPRPAAQIVGGSVLFDGENLVESSSTRLQAIRGSEIAMVFQDPGSALNPVLTIGDQITEPLRIHRRASRSSLRDQAEDLLRLLRVPEPRQRLKSYPHQLSGGMQQRAVSAVALSCGPRVLVADEPTTALDVTVQAAYLELLREIQQRQSLSVLFITHDFGVVAKICDRVLVMYAGQVVESAGTPLLYRSPAHPYTAALMSSVPNVRSTSTRLASIEGQPPSIYELPEGCRFRPRCWLYERLGRPVRCRDEMPSLMPAPNGALARCHYSAESLASAPSGGPMWP